jgi:hypothetical protein
MGARPYHHAFQTPWVLHVCRERLPVSHHDINICHLLDIYLAAVGRAYTDVAHAHLVRVISADRRNH